MVVLGMAGQYGTDQYSAGRKTLHCVGLHSVSNSTS